MREPPKTKAELRAILAEAVRNTRDIAGDGSSNAMAPPAGNGGGATSRMIGLHCESAVRQTWTSVLRAAPAWRHWLGTIGRSL